MPDDISREDVLALAERLVETIGNELEVDDYLSHVGLSVGIAFYPDDGVNAATLLANADSALYRAKREGGGRVRVLRIRDGPGAARPQAVAARSATGAGAEPVPGLLPAAGAGGWRGHRLRGSRCAGTIRRAASCRRTSSFRSPRRTG